MQLKHLRHISRRSEHWQHSNFSPLSFQVGKKTNEVMQQNKFVNLLCNNNKSENNVLFQFQLFIYLRVELTA